MHANASPSPVSNTPAAGRTLRASAACGATLVGGVVPLLAVFAVLVASFVAVLFMPLLIFRSGPRR